MNPVNKEEIKKNDAKLKEIIKKLEEEYECSESPLVGEAIADLYGVKEMINRMT